jgi:recombinational DNA repair protein RecT
MVEAGSLGWNLNPKLGECYLIPFKNKDTHKTECSLMPGFRGLAKLAKGDKTVEYIIPRVVHRADEFSIEYEPKTTLHHRPELSHALRGPVTHVYVVVSYASGRKIYEVMTREEVEDIRRYSKKADGSFWRDHWDEMAKKTIVRRACKNLDSTPQLERALELHDAEYDMETPQKLENNSGNATGQYASDEQAKAYLSECWEYAARRNAAWLDMCQRAGGGTMPEGTRDLIANDWQMDGHLLKWAIGQGLLDPASAERGSRNHNKGKLVAIPYHQSPKLRNDIKRELVVYLDDLERKERDRMARLHPGDDDGGDAHRPEAELEPPDDTPF